jgi:peptide/nickel transport system permease protein
MSPYVVGRILQAIPTLVLTSLHLCRLRLVPGDPASTLAGPDATPESITTIRQELASTSRSPSSTSAGCSK